jgi:hypothetical protein
MLPAVLLTMLFYLDQNISVRAVNACNLKKVRPHTHTHVHAFIQMEPLAERRIVRVIH